MEVFKNIIIALDFKTDEEQAKINHALVIAKAHETTMFTLFTVVPRVISDPEKMITPADKQQEQLVKRAYENLDKVAVYFLEDNFLKNKITCIVEIGDPAVEVVKQVIREQHDMLLISTRKLRTVKKHLLGDTTVEILRHCPCPVWAVKPGTTEERKMMVGIHFDEEVADHNDNLNHQLLNIATAITEKPTAEMHLVNVVNSANDEKFQQQLTMLIGLAKDISNPTFEVFPVILEGNPTVELPNYVEQESIDLLVMGMLSRTGLRGFFIGNTSEKIMDDIDCSILVVKPKEFVSQINI